MNAPGHKRKEPTLKTPNKKKVHIDTSFTPLSESDFQESPSVANSTLALRTPTTPDADKLSVPTTFTNPAWSQKKGEGKALLAQFELYYQDQRQHVPSGVGIDYTVSDSEALKKIWKSNTAYLAYEYSRFSQNFRRAAKSFLAREKGKRIKK